MGRTASMIVFPAVDIKDGRCVRLLQGRADTGTWYYEDPCEAALHWQELGARALHLVDLDGALSQSGRNRRCTLEILRSLTIPVQVGGGLRALRDVRELLDAGAARVILGTRAATEPGWALRVCRELPGRIVIALDALDGEVAIRGWQEGAGVSVGELAPRLAEGGPAAFLYTDVSRDGMLARPNFDGVEQLVRMSHVPVIASGGVSSAEDIRRLGECGADAVVVGKALYEGRLELAEALEAACPFASRLAVDPRERAGRATRTESDRGA